MQELVKENVFILVFELVSCDEGYTQDEKTRIRKLKHGGNMWLRLRKHSGKRVFPLANTLRFFMFPSSFPGPWYENIWNLVIARLSYRVFS